VRFCDGATYGETETRTLSRSGSRRVSLIVTIEEMFDRIAGYPGSVVGDGHVHGVILKASRHRNAPASRGMLSRIVEQVL
jgi:gamma-glutamylcyclotransferase (GGCT)/AIG2-like uncharacterized protein YtfP